MESDIAAPARNAPMARRGRYVVPALPDDSSADKWTEELLKDMPDDL